MLDLAHAAHGRSRERAWRILAGILIAAVIVSGLAYVVFGIGVEAHLDHILILPSWLIVLLVFLLPALEASAFVGAGRWTRRAWGAAAGPSALRPRTATAAAILAAAHPETGTVSPTTTPASYSRGDPVVEASPHGGPFARPDPSPSAEPA